MKAIMDTTAIQKILPHRYPFIMVDKIVELIPDKRIVGVKNVTRNEYFFDGHFPGQPVMPGVLIIEALAQTCGVLAMTSEDKKGKIAFFASIKEAKFRKPVVPGDTIMLEVDILSIRSRIVSCKGTAKVDSEVVAEAEMMFAIMGEQKQA